MKTNILQAIVDREGVRLLYEGVLVREVSMPKSTEKEKEVEALWQAQAFKLTTNSAKIELIKPDTKDKGDNHDTKKSSRKKVSPAANAF